MKIYLIRHGEADSKVEGIPLTKKGLYEAKIVANELLNYNFKKIYFSDLLRAKQTAEIYLELNPDIEIVSDERLREIYRVLIGGPEKMGTSENREINDKKRADEFFEEILKKGDDVAIFCHGNIIRYYLNKVLKSKENIWESLVINNCSISIITLEENNLKIDGINLNKDLAREEKKEVYLE
ncbi:histidine phosphatase family protein [Candidatus Pacearchaeota archaeon]|nr:histidine phosphatase family protein [Candidatus Pacearchaeota archaeon]